jgi:hypothetical protein
MQESALSKQHMQTEILTMTRKTNKATDTFAAILAATGMTQITRKGLMIQPRTRRVAVPGAFYSEPLSPKRAADSGNKHNQISSGVHQSDPNRVVSWSAVMPCHAMHRDTGNPYPASHAHPSVVTSPAWQFTVPMAHAIARAIFAAAGPVTVADIRAAVIAAKVPGATKDSTFTANGKGAFRDVLRDLRNYGFIATDSLNVTRDSVVVTVNPDLAQIEFDAPVIED